MGTAAVDAQVIRAEVAELLGVAADDVPLDADLIGHGLDSIRIMTLSGRWRRRGCDIDFAALTAEPTIAAWTALLGPMQADNPPPQPDRPHGSHDEPFALAPMQHAMWVGRNADQQLGGVAAHLYVEFDGAGVDPERLQRAASKLAARHPMLRVEFRSDGTQRIGDRPLPVTVVDLSELDDTEVQRRLSHTRDAKSHQQLDGEVLQLTLSVLPAGRCRLHVDLDMQAADAVSYRTLMTDLAQLYQGVERTGLQYTYRDYRAAVTGPSAPRPSDTDRQWWQERIPDMPDPPCLPQRPRAQQAEPHRTTRRWHWFDGPARAALFANARQRGITPAMAVAASFCGTLRRWSSSPRFLLNVPLFGREQLHPEVDDLVGDFTSSLLLDVDLSGTVTAAQRAVAVQDAMRAAAAHASYPGLSVLRDLGRYRGAQMLAPVVFTSALGLGELFSSDVTDAFGSPVWILSQGPQVLLDAQVTEFDGGVLVNWDVREHAFPAGVIDAMFAHHIADLRGLGADGNAWDAPDPAAVPREQLAVRDALVTTSEPTGDALHDGFFRSAGETPHAPAVISTSGTYSYGELRDQVQAVAGALQVAGITRGDTVAVMGPKCAEQVIALLAIHAAGAAYVPIGADQPPDRAQRILRAAAVRMALVCGDAAPPTSLAALTVREALRVGSRVRGFTPAVIRSDEVAYVLFTSGSTGEPKGVEVTHGAAMNTVEFINSHFEIGSADRCLALSTLEGDLSVLDVFGMLRAGASLVVVDEAQRRDPDSWARMIDEHRVSVLHFMPGWLEMLLEVSGRLPSVRVVPTGGDWVRTDMVRRLREAAPGVRFAGLGGATETAIHNTICEPGELPPQWTAVPFGRPLPNNVCRVVAADGADCPDWVPGELWVAGRGIANGYRGRPVLTAERFVVHDGRTWYRTGDLARYLPDGLIEFVGRADHRIKVSGYRVELGEVESALQRIDGVDSAVAVVLPAPGDQRGEQLAAIVRTTDPQRSADELRRQMSGFVPDHMVPSHLRLVDHIPFTAGGKVDRRAVAALLTQSMAERVEGQRRRDPVTALERALADIVATVLGADGVDLDDDFFSRGGDSVLATQTVARIREWLDAPDVTVADIFAARTVAVLARRLIEHESGGDRLEGVAELYLDVADMDSAAVAAALDPSSVQVR